MFDSLFQQAKNSRHSRHSSVNVVSLEKYYHELVVKHHLQNDQAQVAVLGHLQQLLAILTQQHRKKRRFPWLTRHTHSKSLYIFGEVGRGKSMMMEFFFQACPLQKKRRVHFHHFMLEVHDFIHHWRQHHHSDPLAAYAKHLRASTWLLCLDEFNVTDIADAMILTRLFEHLFAHGLLFVATSNYHPDDLYQNGLQRALFLPFIQQLKQAADILELQAKHDYRLAHFKTLPQQFYIGTGEQAERFLQYSFATLTHHAPIESVTLQVQNRTVHFKAAHGDILYSSFAELCDRALGAADYIEIANVFHTVFIAHIPQLSQENRDQARRFVTLIDALYEQKVKIVCTLAVAVDKLYRTDSVFEFKRTQSRVMEMQSGHYLQQ
jgi:cell division protein ZapE